MRKFRFFAAIFILFISTTSSFAQKIQIGPHIGLNLSHINGLNNARVRLGTVAGGFIAYNKGNVGFCADILISSKGARTTQKYTTNTSNEIWDSYANLVYLEIPLLATFHLNSNEHQFRPKLFAGPAIAYKLSASESMNYRKDVTNGIDSSFTSTHRITSNYKKADLGLMLGLGFQYQMGTKTYFNFDARYTLGLIDIKKANLPDPLYNRNIAFFIGIGYKIGK